MAGALYKFLYTDNNNFISGCVHVLLSSIGLGVKSNQIKREVKQEVARVTRLMWLTDTVRSPTRKCVNVLFRLPSVTFIDIPPGALSPSWKFKCQAAKWTTLLPWKMNLWVQTWVETFLVMSAEDSAKHKKKKKKQARACVEMQKLKQFVDSSAIYQFILSNQTCNSSEAAE